MSIARVKEYFKKYKMEDKVIEFDVSSATVELAAKALNTEGKRIAKTMSFRLKDKYIDVRNPFNPKMVSRIMLEDVDLLFFCTKNPSFTCTFTI